MLIDARAFPPTESQLAELLADTPVLVVFGGEDGETESLRGEYRAAVIAPDWYGCVCVRGQRLLAKQLPALIVAPCVACVKSWPGQAALAAALVATSLVQQRQALWRSVGGAAYPAGSAP